MKSEELITLINRSPENLTSFFKCSYGVLENSFVPKFGIIKGKESKLCWGCKSVKAEIDYCMSETKSFNEEGVKSMLACTTDTCEESQPIKLFYLKFKYNYSHGSYDSLKLLEALRHTS